MKETTVTEQDIEAILADDLTPTGIEQWWNAQWECTCAESHGTRREFFARNPAAVLEAAKVWAETLPEMDGR